MKEYRMIDHDMFDEDMISLINAMASKGWEIMRILDPLPYKMCDDPDMRFIRIFYERISPIA